MKGNLNSGRSYLIIAVCANPITVICPVTPRYFNEHFVFLAYQGNDTSTEGGARYLCNHRRAYKFFTDSISPKCHFTSFPCENYDKFQAGECFACGSGSATGKECGRLGYYSNQSKGRGSLFLLTRDEEPFCGKYS